MDLGRLNLILACHVETLGNCRWASIWVHVQVCHVKRVVKETWEGKKTNCVTFLVLLRAPSDTYSILKQSSKVLLRERRREWKPSKALCSGNHYYSGACYSGLVTGKTVGIEIAGQLTVCAHWPTQDLVACTFHWAEPPEFCCSWFTFYCVNSLSPLGEFLPCLFLCPSPTYCGIIFLPHRPLPGPQWILQLSFSAFLRLSL